MKKILLLFSFLFFLAFVIQAQQNIKLKKKDRKRDVEVVTTAGTIILRLYDSTPLHRDNFLRLVKSNFYDSILFHRVIKNFMIQAGDPNSKNAEAGKPLGNGSPGYTVDAEIKPFLFHKKGTLAAARTGDNVNPERKSSGSQFYIVQGKTFTDKELDSIQVARLSGRQIPDDRRTLYKTIGGTPQLDGNYTVFGEVVGGLEVVDQIANTTTNKQAPAIDRPLQDIRIIKMKLVKRKKR